MKRLIDHFFPLFLTALLLLCLRWNTMNVPFERDEGEYAYAAWLWAEGGLPYRDAFMQKPPMIIYTYWVGQLFGDALWIPRLLAFLFILISSYLLGRLAEKKIGKGTAIPVMFSLLSPN
jgi:4-amino-4-deoxy-L-arabinose transferase-like glycosyltransferase